jgi:hypothetical protein
MRSRERRSGDIRSGSKCTTCYHDWATRGCTNVLTIPTELCAANTESDERVANLRFQFACVLVNARPPHPRPELLPAGRRRHPLARMTSLRRTSGQGGHPGPTCLERLRQVSTHLGDRSCSCRWRSRFAGVMPDLAV